MPTRDNGRPHRSQGPLFYLVINDGDNSAFKPHPSDQISRILVDVARQVLGGHINGPVRDVNGNKVGRFELRQEEVSDDHPND